MQGLDHTQPRAETRPATLTACHKTSWLWLSLEGGNKIDQTEGIMKINKHEQETDGGQHFEDAPDFN